MWQWSMPVCALSELPDAAVKDTIPRPPALQPMLLGKHRRVPHMTPHS